MGSAEADKLMKQADKHCNPSFFSMRLKGDWEQATPLYEKAAKLYKVNQPRIDCLYTQSCTSERTVVLNLLYE